MKIQGYGPSVLPQQTQQPAAGKPGNFGALVKQYAEQMNHDHKAADAASVDLAVNGKGNVAETLLAVQKADLSFQLLLSARNKLVDAYREVMRMQV